MSKKDTVGKIASDLLLKTPESQDPIEIQREVHKEYEDHIFKVVEEGKNKHYDDFFIVVITKRERLLANVIRNYFFTRESCPTPDYDQTVYHYHNKHDELEFLWVLPSKDTCQLFKANALQIAPEERHLLEFILQDSNGELLALSKRLNREIEA